VNRGAVMIAYGRPAVDQARLAIETLHRLHPTLPALLVGDSGAAALGREMGVEHFLSDRRDRGGRWQKVRLDQFSTFDQTLYLDADTRVLRHLDAGFGVLDDGWDLAIAPSSCQGQMMLWHVGDEEKRETIECWPCRPLQLQGGVFFFRRSKAVSRFFRRWREEWHRWEDQDQGALLRAYRAAGVKVWLLGRPWNGGSVVNHLFGMAQERRGA
jgi:hypothetical protein